MYKISLYTYKQAKKLGVQVKPSTRKNKKLDVYKKGEYLVSVGDSRYLDFSSYKQMFGKEIAEIRRKEYLRRHKKDIKNKGSAGYYAAKLLW